MDGWGRCANQARALLGVEFLKRWRIFQHQDAENGDRYT
jgi:hypothetical protein